MNINARNMRQRDIVPDSISEKNVCVVGCGAIGRNVSMMIASMGPKSISLLDFDRVDRNNLTTQGYKEDDLGKLKVAALSDAIHETYSDVSVTQIVGRAPLDMPTAGIDIWIMATDTIQARIDIYKHLYRLKNYELVVDGRLLAENMRIICGGRGAFKKGFKRTLFDPKKEMAGRCTARATLYSANICAGLMANKIVRHFRNERYKFDSFVSLPGELWTETK